MDSTNGAYTNYGPICKERIGIGKDVCAIILNAIEDGQTALADKV
jgi:hypothetical protein